MKIIGGLVLAVSLFELIWGMPIWLVVSGALLGCGIIWHLPECQT